MITDTDFDSIYGTKYFGVSDLRGQQLHRKIGKVEIAELKENDGSTKRKFVIFFEGEDKALPLNRTNARQLALALGKDASKWVGATVELYSEMTSLGKEGVRLRVLRPPHPKSESMNDIPWK